MKKAILYLILAITLTSILATGVFIHCGMLSCFTISQKVSENEMNDYMPSYSGNLMHPIANDSVWNDYLKSQIEYEKRYTRPYKLTTEYKGICLIDYGTFKEIDSLKCIRFKEVERQVFVRDSLEAVSENELLILNKSCN